MPKQITQAELRAVLDGETFVNRRMMQIRERLKKGATVEPGELGAATDCSDDFAPECSSYSNMGLLIDSADATERYQAMMDRAIAEARRSKLTVIRGGNLEVAHA